MHTSDTRSPQSMLSAIRAAGFEPDAAYARWEKVLTPMMICTEPYEPPRLCDSSGVQQAKQDRSDSFRLGWHGADKLAFAEDAKRLPHPAESERVDLPADVLRAVEVIVGKRSAIAAWRSERVALLRQAARALKPLNERILAAAPAHVLFVVRDYNLALMALVVDASRYPDKYIVRRFLYGFPAFGELPSTGIYNAGGTLPVKDSGQVLSPDANQAWNARLEKSIKARALDAEQAEAAGAPEAMHGLRAVHEATMQELRERWVVGVEDPSSPDGWRCMLPSEVADHSWLGGRRSYRAARRFGVHQKGKWRPVDDESENGINDITGSREKLSLIGSDWSAHVAAALVRERIRWERDMVTKGLWSSRSGEGVDAAVRGGIDSIEESTDDVKKAYRRIPCARCWVVFFWNVRTRRVEAVIVPSFVFGAVSAVMAWNRFPAMMVHMSRRFLACTSGHFFDDLQRADPAYAGRSAQRAESELFSLVGIGFEPSKSTDPNQLSVSLGVLKDYTHVPLRAVVYMSVTEERREKLLQALEELRRSRWLTHAGARKLLGKARWVLCPRFGRVGLASLQPLRDVTGSQAILSGSELDASLLLLERIVRAARPACFPLLPSTERPQVVLSDASFRRLDGYGELGVVVWDRGFDQWHYTSMVAPSWLVRLMQQMTDTDQKITQLELVAVACAYFTFPDLLCGRLVHHFVDNQPALAGCISGSSGRPDSALILHELQVKLVEIQCQPWFGFVYSEDNLADPPSRGDFVLMRQLRARWRRCVLPPFSGWLQASA